MCVAAAAAHSRDINPSKSLWEMASKTFADEISKLSCAAKAAQQPLLF
jgi:hypothetical protein